MTIRSFILSSIICVVMASSSFAQVTTFPFTGVITADKVNIRAGQNKNFEAIGSVQKGDQVVVVDQSFSWYKIKLPDQAQSFISREFVQLLRDKIGEITGNRVNVRARAVIESSVVGQLSKATKVKVVETLAEWYRIEPVEGLYGWVLTEFVEFQSNQIPPPKVVQLPSKNIYRQKRDDDPLAEVSDQGMVKEEQEKSVLQGTIIAIAQDVPGVNIRHQIASDDGRVFYLMGYRSVLDGFLNHRVEIEGLPQSEPVLAHPVLLVTKVLLVL